MTKIYCPHCQHALGDTNTSIDGHINCRWCRKAVAVKMIVASTTDYFNYKEKKND